MAVEWNSSSDVCMYVFDGTRIKNCVEEINFNYNLQRFNDREELLRNMMGLVGNVAEVKRLRNRLMKTEFITVFAELLDSSSDGIEVRAIFILSC